MSVSVNSRITSWPAKGLVVAVASSFLGLLIAQATMTLAQSEETDAVDTSLVEYLSSWKIDVASRQILVEPTPWNAAKQQFVLRVMARLKIAPVLLGAQWNANALEIDSSQNNAAEETRVQDRFVRISGRAIFVAPQVLSKEQAEIADRKQIDVVRIVGDNGLVVDVLTDRAPKAWPRWQTIDEPAAATGLPLSLGDGPHPVASTEKPEQPEQADKAKPEQANWPSEPHSLLVAATRVSWFPPTPLGSLGMDYGLFDTVVDGQKLVSGDTEAFYAVLAALGRTTQTNIETAAGPPADIVPMIDPGQDWFVTHRGDPVTIDGVALRATRIEIDDPLRRKEIGTDHYWELFVFVDTALIKVNDRLQENYPIVCCVRSLPKEMPTGENINEHVRVSGFALKRYEYLIATPTGQDQKKNDRQETPLLIGKRAVWLPDPSAAEAGSTLGWVFTGIAGFIGLILLAGAWAISRDAQKQAKLARSQLPDRVQLP